MLPIWFFPCWSGDIRLERNGNGCTLTVVDPTPADREFLAKFLPDARSRGWIDDLAGVQPKGTTVIPVDMQMSTVAPLLANVMHPTQDTWTAVRYSNGKVEIVFEGNGFTEAQSTALVAQADAEPTAVVTTQKPQRGCPEPTPAARRASEVLRAFSTRTQWDQWEREGRMTVHGNFSGRAFHVYHSNEAYRRGHRRCLVDANGIDICAWDDSVPTEEQALSLKLAVEHRERWLLGMAASVTVMRHMARIR